MWWWTVFVAIIFIKENLNSLLEWRVQLVTRGGKDKLYLIADAIRDLTSIPKIYNDLFLLLDFHKVWLYCHFEWLQGSDETLNSQPGFLMQHMLVRFYIMER